MRVHAPTSKRHQNPYLRGEMRLRATCLALIGGLAIGAGCSPQSGFTRRHGMLGALKTNVAQLESEKDNLSRELATQKAENRRIESELAAVESQNGDLAARLDDARTVMTRQGLAEGRSTLSASDDDRGSKRKASPVKNPPRSRKTPFAQIPKERRDLDESEIRSPEDLLDSPRPRDDRDELGPQSRLDDNSPWLPVARGRSSPTRSVR